MDFTVPHLSDGVTVLRAMVDDDAPAYAALHRDPLNVRWAGSDAAMTQETALAQIRTDIPAHWADGTSLRFAVVEAASVDEGVVDEGVVDVAGPNSAGQLRGTVSLHHLFRAADGGGAAAVGVKMSADGRGKGSARRAVELICGYAFGTLGLDVLHWQTTAGNNASRALAEKCGFALTATLPSYGHVDGRIADSWLLSRQTEHWTARRDAGRASGAAAVTAAVAPAAVATAAEPAAVDPGAAELQLRPVVPRLEDSLVVLRALKDSDAEALVANCCDLEAVRWTSVPLGYTARHAAAFINNITPEGWRSGETLTFAVADPQTDVLLGTIDLQCGHPGAAAVGINLGPHARGSGQAERAVRLLADYAFNQLNLSYLHWSALVPNWASRKLAWKTGFTFEGHIRGDYNDRGTPADRWMLTLAATDPRTPASPWDGPPPPTG